MNFFKRPQPAKAPDPEPDADPAPRADETAPGVRMLKDVWNIQSGKKPRDSIEHGSVSSDIYKVPSTGNNIPHRPHHGHPEDH